MTGNQEYHPVYVSPGNLSNTARRGHGIGVLPVAFLPIPKGMILVSFTGISGTYTLIQLVTLSVRALNSNSLVGSYITHASKSSSHLFDHIWSLPRLCDVLTATFTRLSLAWDLTLQITQSRCG